MIAAWEKIEVAVVVAIPVLLLIGIGCAWLGSLMGKEPGMMHENEPQGPREWRPAGWRPLNEPGPEEGKTGRMEG